MIDFLERLLAAQRRAEDGEKEPLLLPADPASCDRPAAVSRGRAAPADVLGALAPSSRPRAAAPACPFPPPDAGAAAALRP